MFDDVLIESAGKDKKKGGWKTVLISAFLHIIIIGAVVAAGLYVKKNPEIITKPIQAFVVSAPPPPPPPPPAASHAATPHVQQQTPQTHPTFHQPTHTPQEVPQPDVPTDTTGGQEGGVV
ncbi:MAG TPA: hypothetical protein VF713_04400, partial [Thermoanaerobaculia bacterium]